MAGAAHPALDDDELTFCAPLLLRKHCLSSLGRKTLYGHLQQQHYLRAKHKNNYNYLGLKGTYHLYQIIYGATHWEKETD